MAQKNLKSILSLPQSTDIWYLGSRQLRVWITPKDKEPHRPYLMIVVNLGTGLMHDLALTELPPSPSDVEKFLFANMKKPKKELQTKPLRPAQIFFEDNRLQRGVAAALQAAGVQAKYCPQSELLMDLVKNLENHLRGERPEIPGLLSQKGINPKIMGNLFAAAADYYRASPWICLANEDILSIRVLPQKEPFYAIVMGRGGVEYGLALYQTWEDVERNFQPKDHPEDWMPLTGAHSFLYNDITEVPFDDVDAIIKYGWEVADQQAYPVPMIYIPPDQVKRPGREEILWYEAALRAIPVFVKEHLKVDEQVQIIPSEAQIPVQIFSGLVTVEIKTPAGELPKSGTWGVQLESSEEEGEAEPSFDRRAMEGEMTRLTMDMGAEGISDSQVQKAQALMYQAWEERNPAKRINLAYQALRVSTNCADAYVLLAEEEAGTPEHALRLYVQGVEAGKRALGEDYFKENAGHFWGLLETRPYMRALEGVAHCEWILDRREESLGHYQELLRLNPGDNQGIRYVLTDLYLGLNKEKELTKLIRQYNEDWTSVWLYTQALLAYRKGGENEKANRALDAALEQNSFVPGYLIGKKRVPGHLPDYIGWGDDTEAANYAADHLNYWRQTPGAVEWVKRRFSDIGSKLIKPQKDQKPSEKPRVPSIWAQQLTEDQLATTETLALRRDMLSLLTYLRDQRVTGTQATGNLPLKAVREISSQFVYPPKLEETIGDHTFRIRSEADVWPLYFLHLLAANGGLIEGGLARRWRLTPEGDKFMADPPPAQIWTMFAAWWKKTDWIAAFPFEGMGEGLPVRFKQITLKRLLKLSVEESVPFEPFAERLIEGSGLVWPIADQKMARDILHSAIQRMVILPLADFGVLVTEYQMREQGGYEFRDLVAFRITRFGKGLLKTLN